MTWIVRCIRCGWDAAFPLDIEIRQDGNGPTCRDYFECEKRRKARVAVERVRANEREPGARRG